MINFILSTIIGAITNRVRGGLLNDYLLHTSIFAFITSGKPINDVIFATWFTFLLGLEYQGFDSTTSPVNQTFTVETSADGSNWTTRGTIGPFADQTAPKELLAGTDYTAATAQYWKLSISNANGSANPPVCGELEMFETS